MENILQNPAILKISPPLLLSVLLWACGGGGTDSAATEDPSTVPPSNEVPVDEPPVITPITKQPSNQIIRAYFRDQDSTTGKLTGVVTIEASDVDKNDSARAESVWVYWADEQGNKLGDAWLKTDADAVYQVVIPADTLIPENIRALLLYPSNEIGQTAQGSLVVFHDFVGNAALSGPGGNESQSWYYGDDRPNISVQRTDGGLCIFDNGLVSVTDMNNRRDEAGEANSGDWLPNEINDSAFPAYQFSCDENPVHNEDEISDEYGIWTYSTLNDAMFYGTVVYDTFLKYLGEPPLDDKIRLRVHYGEQSDTSVYWDGAYANFSDGYLFQYSMASLDAIGHEIGHGVLNRISDLNMYEHELSDDARTLHEAFGDLAGVMAKYEFTGHSNNWIHGEESEGLVRYLDQIQTEPDAITSQLDYDDAGDNFYRRIGMITYPFYLLSKQWGLEPAYQVYLSAAKTCWSAQTTLTQAAECIKQQAGVAGLSEADVVAAFKTVKIKLFDDGVLSHFTAEKYKLRTEFTDSSLSTNQVTHWLWDFGDGQTSTQASPEHTYAQAGDYQVKLTVSDQSNDQDNFTRLISVTDQYCGFHDTFTAENLITSVMVNGIDINYDPTKWDYTQTPVELTDADNVVINILGDNAATAKPTTWRIWIDLNDNGVFGDQSEELIVDTFADAGQPYGFSTALDLSTLENNGEAKQIRIYGDTATFSPCYAAVGEALDLRVIW